MIRVRKSFAAMFALCIAAGSPAFAAGSDFMQDDNYGECLQRAVNDPETAFEEASAWRDLGGGLPAKHCAAVALFGLGQFKEAATRLEQLAQEPVPQPEVLSPQLLGQAGNAWLMAGDYERAYATLTAGLKIAPDSVELLIDRSLALAATEHYWETVDDLNHALDIDPEHVDALVFRASAYRYLGTLELATDDIDRALWLAPYNIPGLLERGNIRRLKGDPAGARADWLEVVTRAPDSPAAEAARRNLERLDVASD